MMLDLNKIKDSLTPEEVINLVTELGSDTYIEKEDCIIFKTICHNINPDDASMKLYYYKKDHRFMCYTGCSCSFNIFTLFQKRYELLNQEFNFFKDIVLKITKGQVAFKHKEGFYSEYESIQKKYDKDIIQVEYNKINENILSGFESVAIPEWIEDGISYEIMKVYNILYSISRNKIVIPHYDVENNLIGIRGRALNVEDLLLGKYMPLEVEGKMYSHALGYNLYGLNVVKDNIKRFKMGIISEGEKSPMQYGTMFGQDKNICVAACGSSIHKYQIDLLRQSGAERILIAFDKEGETNLEREKYFNKLMNICKRYKNVCDMGFIFDTKNLLELKESPFDKGKEVFKQLYKEAVWI